MQNVLLVLVLFFIAGGIVSAQDTETPAPTPSETAIEILATPSETATPEPTLTATNTLTATPELMVYWTLQAPSSTGTPAAPQYVAVKMEATLGDIAIVIVGVACFVLMLVGFALEKRP